MQARALEDPMVSVRTMTGPDETKTGGMVSQKIPLFGKRGLMGRAAQAESGIAEQASINAKWRLIAQTKMAYYELFWFDQALRINREMKDIVANLEQIAQLQYATGKVSQQDVLKAQIELAKINNEIIAMEQMKAAAVTELNGLLNRPATAPLGEPATLVLKPLKLSLEQLVEQAVQYSPELKMAQLEIDKDKAMLSLSRRQYYPDLTFSVEYNRITNGSSDNEWGGGVGINLPIWVGKYNAAVREAEANQRAGEKNYQSVHNMTMVDIKNGYIKSQAAWRVMESYGKTLIPQAEQSLAASRMAYQTGKADFLDLLDSVRMLLDLKLGLYRAQVDYKTSLAELELCCAFPVESAVGGEEN
jgi:outer membrane protein TolC